MSSDPRWMGVFLLCVASPLWAQGDPTLEKESDWVDDRFNAMDTGPVFCGSIATPDGDTNKGLVVRLNGGEGGACFDTELLTWRVAWVGGFLHHDPTRFGLIRLPSPRGDAVFKSAAAPGWASSDGSFKDPRPTPFGPLPKAWGRLKGWSLHGQRVAIRYEVGGVPIVESVRLIDGQGGAIFVRDFRIAAHEKPLVLRVADRETAVGLIGHSAWVSIGAGPRGSVAATISPSPEPIGFSLTFAPASIPPPELQSRLTDIEHAPPDTTPGPGRWGDPLITKGTLGSPDSALAIDTLTVPYDNPWKALMFTSGHDFFSNGDAAVSTIHGDVWRVRGIDDKLDRLTWKRYATGLYQPLGLRIIEDRVYVIGRDQITRLHDVNGDGEADFYETFNNEMMAGGGHEYATCLETDASGDFYFLKCAGPHAHAGSLLRVPHDGEGIEVVATGFRNPNGMGIGPEGQITVGDQQGNWVPATRVDLVQPGGFYGFMPTHHRTTAPTIYDGPLCWIPRTIDNSAGGQAWVPRGAWGAMGGQLLHFSYGRCTMMMILRDRVGETWQGAVVPLPGRFLSGVMRGRFNPCDGHLYATGSDGWQTAAVRDGCFQRVRYTGGDMGVPVAWRAKSDGLRVTFAEPLDVELATDVGSYALERWDYRWTQDYGSADWSVSDPNRGGRDSLTILSAELVDDQRTVVLKVKDMRPAMQLELRYDLETSGGRLLRGAMYPTIHGLHP